MLVAAQNCVVLLWPYAVLMTRTRKDKKCKRHRKSKFILLPWVLIPGPFKVWACSRGERTFIVVLKRDLAAFIERRCTRMQNSDALNATASQCECAVCVARISSQIDRSRVPFPNSRNYSLRLKPKSKCSVWVRSRSFWFTLISAHDLRARHHFLWLQSF